MLHRRAHAARRLTDNRLLKFGHLNLLVSRHLQAWILLGLVTPPQPFAEAERKASPETSIIRFPKN
jgi:hypothetical protein